MGKDKLEQGKERVWEKRPGVTQEKPGEAGVSKFLFCIDPLRGFLFAKPKHTLVKEGAFPKEGAFL